MTNFYSESIFRKRNKISGSTFELLIAFFICVGLLSLVVLIFSFHKVNVPSLDEIQELFVSQSLKFVHPKPLERFVFLTTVMFLPLLSLVAVKLVLFVQIKSKNQIANQHIKIIALSLPFMLPLFLYHSPYINYLTSNVSHSMVALSLISLLLPMALALLIQDKYSFSLKYERQIIFIIGITAVLYQTIASRIMSVYSVNYSWPWVGHFEALFYSLSQVVGGKTLLADLSAPYGLFPEILKPIFTLIGLSVFKFTLLMGLLQIVSLFCIFSILRKYLKNSLLIILCMLSLCITTGNTWRVINLGHTAWDAYYAYFPLRILFPCLSLFLLSRFIYNKSLTNLIVLAFTSAVAMIWNFDSGVSVAGTFLLYLSSFILFPMKDFTRKQAVQSLFLVSGIVLVTLMLFVLYLHLKTDAYFQIMDTLKYHKLFYIMGYGLFPMPYTFDMWQIIFGTYVLGLISFVYARMKNFGSKFWDLVFCISILGIGIFVYYEGEASWRNLINVSWPAVILAFLFCDRILSLIRKKMIPKFAIIFCIPIIAFGFFTSSSYILGAPSLYSFGVAQWTNTFNQTQTLITENINFMKEVLQEEKNVAIWLPNQAVYFGELGLASAVQGPGLIELVLKSDLKNMMMQIASGIPKILFISASNVNLEEIKQLLNNYNVIEIHNGIAYLRRVS